MSKAYKRTIIGIVISFAVMAAIALLPTPMGCFAFMLVAMISRALPDWAAVIAAMVLLCATKVGTVATVTSQFATSTVWLCIGVFIMSIGVNNSGIMKRLALWILTKFPGTYAGQVTAI